MEKHFVRVKKNGKNKPQPYLLHYISYVQIEALKEGRATIEGYNEDGTAIVVEEEGHIVRPGSAWNNPFHNAGTYGSEILATIIGDKRFTFPKSIYSEVDVLRYFISDKPNALVIDFFAGSGTTLNAINVLNAEDGGHRRCIMVTNNEVSESEAKDLTKKGYRPGDEEWEKLGIARYVTWPRTVCSIEGHDVNGKPLKGNYLGSDLPMADGFAANCEYFKLGFLDRDMVSLGRQFQEILPMLWMKSGAVGKRPEIDEEEPIMLVLPENHFAVLVEDAAYAAFACKVKEFESIDTVYFVTNSEAAFHEMSADIGIKNTYQLYRDYIDNFVIGARRDRT